MLAGLGREFDTIRWALHEHGIVSSGALHALAGLPGLVSRERNWLAALFHSPVSPLAGGALALVLHESAGRRRRRRVTGSSSAGRAGTM
jgi:hypothetical protein